MKSYWYTYSYKHLNGYGHGTSKVRGYAIPSLAVIRIIAKDVEEQNNIRKVAITSIRRL